MNVKDRRYRPADFPVMAVCLYSAGESFPAHDPADRVPRDPHNAQAYFGADKRLRVFLMPASRAAPKVAAKVRASAFYDPAIVDHGVLSIELALVAQIPATDCRLLVFLGPALVGH